MSHSGHLSSDLLSQNAPQHSTRREDVSLTTAGRFSCSSDHARRASSQSAFSCSGDSCPVFGFSLSFMILDSTHSFAFRLEVEDGLPFLDVGLQIHLIQWHAIPVEVWHITQKTVLLCHLLHVPLKAHRIIEL